MSSNQEIFLMELDQLQWRCVVDDYRMALIFRRSKFLRIAALKEFVEKFHEFKLSMCVTVQWLKF